MEGTVPFKIPGIKSPAHTWYKVYGDLRWTKPGILPLVILHGGRTHSPSKPSNVSTQSHAQPRQQQPAHATST